MTRLGSEETVRRLNNLRRLRALGLDEKICYAMRLIEAGFLLGARPAVAWSGGKDSTVLLHLVRQIKPDIITNWNNTGVEFPETYSFIKQIRDEWGVNLHITRHEDGKDFWWCVEQLGWPLLGKAFSRRRSVFYTEKQRKVAESGVRISPSCCWYLKEKPARDFYRAGQIDVTFTGILAGESRQRQFTWIDYGDLYFTKHEQIWKCNPLSIWTDEDIWEYHHRFDVPHCKLYDMGHRRNGCWPCMMDFAFADNHLATLRQTHPKLWRFLIVDKGLGSELLKIKLALNDGQGDLFSYTWPNVEKLIQVRPCFFDRL